MNQKLALIKIELANGKCLDVVSKAIYSKSKYYTTFSKFERIKKYIKANSIKTPISDKVIDTIIQMKLIKKRS